MIITEDLKKCVTNRAAEISVHQMAVSGTVDITKAVEQATEEVKTAMDNYMAIMRLMSVKMSGDKTPSGLPLAEAS